MSAVARCFAPRCTWAPTVRTERIALDALSLHAQSHRPSEQDLDRTFAGVA